MSDLSLEIHHLDVRGGDATAIVFKDMEQDTATGGKTLCRLLIDAGAEGKGSAALMSYLQTHLGGTSFDGVIATHYHQDHIQGFSQANIKFKYFVDNGAYADGNANIFAPRNDIGAGARTTIFDAYKTRVQEKMVHNPKAPDAPDPPARVPIDFIERSFDLRNAQPITWNLVPGSDIKLTCYAANGILANGDDVLGKQYASKRKVISPNDVSLAFLLEWGNFAYLTTGDLSGDTEQSSYYDIETKLVDYLAKVPLAGKRLTVYKASHHGSEHSNQSHLFQTLKPDTTIVCCNMQKQVPSPIFLSRLADYFEDKPDATVVFTNTMKVFKNDDRYAPLEKIRAHTAASNLAFVAEPSGETFATNLGVKCALIRRRVKNGTVFIDPAQPHEAFAPIDRTSHEILLRKRDSDDETNLSATVKFTSYDQVCNWLNSNCDDQTVSDAFRDSQIPALRTWLAQDGPDNSAGKDYIAEHFPALVAIIDKSDPTTLAQDLLAEMNRLFSATFRIDKSAYPWKWIVKPKSENQLTSDQKKTIWMLLRNNSHQSVFNKAINWLNGNRFNEDQAWNVADCPEPYTGTTKRKGEVLIAERSAKKKRKDPP